MRCRCGFDEVPADIEKHRRLVDEQARKDGGGDCEGLRPNETVAKGCRAGCIYLQGALSLGCDEKQYLCDTGIESQPEPNRTQAGGHTKSTEARLALKKSSMRTSEREGWPHDDEANASAASKVELQLLSGRARYRYHAEEEQAQSQGGWQWRW